MSKFKSGMVRRVERKRKERQEYRKRRKEKLMRSGEFSVCQFFTDDNYEYVRMFVTAEEAMKAAHFYTHNVAAKMGIVERVIITDGGDSTVFEWKKGEGIVWPEDIKAFNDSALVKDQRRDADGRKDASEKLSEQDRGGNKNSNVVITYMIR